MEIILKIKLSKCLLFLFILTGIQGFSQDFSWQSKTGPVETKGFHEILLSPDIIGKLRNDMGDLRIYDSTGSEVPYILYSEKPVEFKQMFKEYTIIKKEHHGDYTRLVIHNPEKNEITNFSLEIKNADVRKWLTLNASDDQKQWYALKEHYYYQSFYNNDNTSEIRVLNFPRSNYEYYELLVCDYYDNPINILKAGYYDLSIEAGKYSAIANPNITQTDTLKQSIIKIEFSGKQYIDKLQFEVEGPEFYYRNASLSLGRVINVKGVSRMTYEQIKPFNLSSNSHNTETFSSFPATELYLIIENYDDHPLKIKGVKAFQLNHYLTANLNSGEMYTIKFGNEKLSPPVYDLKFFADSIPDNIPRLNSGKVSEIIREPKEDDKPFYVDPVFIWIALGIVALILGLFSFKMVKEMKK